MLEVTLMKLLERIYKDIIDPEKREHVHLNFFNYKTGMATDNKLCPVKTIKCPKSFRRPRVGEKASFNLRYFVRAHQLFMKSPSGKVRKRFFELSRRLLSFVL